MELFNFQRLGVAEILRRLKQQQAVLLADEQGLGKTIQAIHVAYNLIPNSMLVVCPASLRFNWEREILDAFPEWLPIQVIQKHKELSGIKELNGIYIVSYNTIASTSVQGFLNHKFDVVVIDEAHYIKNASRRTKATFKVAKKAKKAVYLTGTPMPNYRSDGAKLWCAIAPHLFPTQREYLLKYCDLKKQRFGMDSTGAINNDMFNALSKEHVYIRRTKKEVLLELPDKTYKTIPVEVSKEAVEASNLALEAYQDYEEVLNQGMHLMTLRRVLGAAKAQSSETIEYVKSIIETNGKVVVFAHHVDVIAHLEEKLKAYNPVVVVGGVSATEKQKAVDSFQTDESCKVFIGNLTSAGTGITLTASSDVIFVEFDWVPGINEQAEDRCHRIGQKKTVAIHYIVAYNTLDVHIRDLLTKKRRNIKMSIETTKQIDHQARSHAKYSPSGASRWLVCESSISLEERLRAEGLIVDETSSDSAAEGTLAHELAEKMLTGEPYDTNDYPPEMVEHINGYIDFIRGIEEKIGDNLTFTRTEHQVTFIPELATGTADYVAIDTKNNVGIVVDLKYGSQQVIAKKNPQLAMYAVSIAGMYGVSTVATFIYSPRMEVTRSKWILETPELLEWQKTLGDTIERIEQGNARGFVISDSGCQWCRCRSHCPAHRQVVTDVFADAVVTPKPIDSLTVPEIQFMFRNEKTIEKYYKSLRAHVFSQIKAGNMEIDGVSIGRTNPHRKWSNEAEVARILIENNCENVFSVKSVSQIEKTIDMETKKMLQEYIEKPIGEEKLIY